MSYKYYSQTTSGWEISTDPKADPNKRWRAVHPLHGERFFDAHHKILEYTVKRMFKEAKALIKKGDFTPVALCGRCGGRWWVDTRHPPRALQGVCMDCQEDSGTEKPLTFVLAAGNVKDVLDQLPLDWLAP